MTIKYQPKISQSDVEMGRAYQNAYYLDESATDSKIAIGNLFGLKSDGTTNAYTGEVTSTMIEADASSGIKAVGFVYRDSEVDQDIRRDRVKFVDDPYYYTYGNRESQELVPMKVGGVVVIDSERDYHFNTVKEVISGVTVEVAGGALDTVIASVDVSAILRVGDLISIGGVVREVLTIAVGGLSFDVTVAFSGAIASGTAISVESDLERPLWLGDNGLFRKSTPQSGEWKQFVGYVENGNNIRVEISVVGEIVA